MSVEFRVLGRIEVRARGTNVALGSLKQRLLLATLLLNPGRTVPIRRLVRALWADEPPMSAVANLRTYVNRLRQVLPGGGQRIVGRQAGYELTLRPGELDLHLFTERADAGRAALSRGDHATAARHLGEALSTCRGAVLEDLAGCAALAASIAPVEELRLAVSEDHFDARLGLGEHHELIAPLREFVSDHPLRERPRAHLVTALYRAGDLAGALAVYTDYRRVIADRLGLEPSPKLVELHQAVLDRDPKLTAAVAVRVSSVPAPRELPAPCRSFSGRGSEVARLQALLARDAPAVAVVHGPCGVGKSALALEAAHRAAPVFPDGQLYVDLRQATRVPHRLLRHLGVSEVPHAVDEAAALLRSRLADRAVLMVLDGATDPAPLRDLLPATGPCAVLITSRAPLLLDGAEHLRLGPLSDADGLELLTRLAPRAESEPAAAGQIVQCCHGIPLALHIAGTILAHRPARPLSWLARRLAPRQRRLDELSFGGESVRAACATAVSAVTDPLTAAAFRLLGGHELCDVTAAATLLGADVLETEAALDRLVDLGLAEWGDGDTYRLPGLMRLFAADQNPVAHAVVFR
ncbi:BTAD domain-containing putative transcriptional regulator [Lentzea sp. BCCO 10_0856]|uniref:BTAD domain-containing putative transcriptional regulator n=1 Tax=Lentzea miocenica TaxID=3095431 RepID=A0ABU4T1E9_9PSEU|nr:BTAD domain-containing putative transcriptional regulator [Lentzea sp. BCCO 10_0856]MDX8031930.1 BTAD domain-containing putative transcriptional regulator [Lentzea sp. BCCO 10_0856]